MHLILVASSRSAVSRTPIYAITLSLSLFALRSPTNLPSNNFVHSLSCSITLRSLSLFLDPPLALFSAGAHRDAPSSPVASTHALIL